MHHAWSAPIAVVSIYAHPVEFLLANVPVVLGPPMLFTPHVAGWAVWAGAASLAIISGHIGWHLPFLGSPEAHDFHHSLNGGRNLDNLGQVDVLDRVLHTNKEFLKSWQYTVHKGYTTPDYPVDKALATTEKPLPA